MKNCQKGHNLFSRHPKPPEFKKYPRQYLKNKKLFPYLKLMKESLKKRNLLVKLAETDYTKFQGQKIRIVEEKNPLWYRELCSKYIKERGKYGGKKRKNKTKENHNTKINRKCINSALENLIKNSYSHSIYFKDLVEIAEKIREQEAVVEQLHSRGASLDEICVECPLYIDLAYF